jgi:glycosyltransferase involved in cell wall biosynthesis
MSDRRTVDIAVAARFHAYQLASELAALGRLGDIFSLHHTFVPPPNIGFGAFHNRIDLALRNDLARFVPALRRDTSEDVADFEDWVIRQLERKTPQVLHGWNGHSRRTFRALRNRGWKLCVERSCPHNMTQYNLLTEEGRLLDVPHRENLDKLNRDIEELHLSDVIVAPSSYSAKSYDEYPELTGKVRINPLGSNTPYEERAPRPEKLVVLMVGNAFLRKGTHYLIEAFKQLDDRGAELWIRGEVPESYRSRLNDPRVKIIPPMLRRQLRGLYRSATVFVQPSIDEGFGLTVLEALAYGLPVVATENVGAAELLTPDVSVIVPIRDAAAIAEAIPRAAALAGPAFDVARRQIIERNSWAACASRMLDVYFDG